MKGIVVCSGSISDYTYLKKYFDCAGLVICADGGAFHLRNFGIKPDILVGDLDSISPSDYDAYKDGGVEILEYPKEKDMTDTELAAALAVERGCKSLVFLGAAGTRLDHTTANILLLKKLLDLKVKGLIADERNEVMLIGDNISFPREEGMKVSLLPISGSVEGVTTTGLLYALSDATIELGSSWGISNEFTAEIAGVSIKSGLLLVIRSRD